MRNYAYVYDPANWQLTNIQNGVGRPTVIGLDYDVQGNLCNKSGVVHDFDYGNQLRSVTGQDSYRYDG